MVVAPMTTLIIAGNSNGTRRCDARCHNAASVDCDCVCGGRYHGAGANAAAYLRDDILEHVPGVLESFERRANELTGGHAVIVGLDGRRPNRHAQLTLDDARGGGA